MKTLKFTSFLVICFILVNCSSSPSSDDANVGGGGDDDGSQPGATWLSPVNDVKDGNSKI
jgi:hypothetical protein